MAITLVAAVSATPGLAGGSTAAIDTTGASLLVVSMSWYHGGAGPAITVSDSKGNTWTLLTIHFETVTAQRFYYTLTPTVGTGHTFTVGAGGTGIYPVILAYAFAGVASYQTESGTSSGSAVSSLASGSVTPSGTGALVLTGYSGQSAVTDSVAPSGFTLTSQPYIGGQNMQGSAAWQVQSPAAAINPTWSFSPSQGSASVGTAVFLPAAAAAVATTQAYVWGPV
jgi:hypothetical protein